MEKKFQVKPHGDNKYTSIYIIEVENLKWENGFVGIVLYKKLQTIRESALMQEQIGI